MQISFAILLFWAPLSALEFYPKEWIRASSTLAEQNLNLMEQYIYHVGDEEKKMALREIWIEGCQSANLRYVTWALQKQKETALCLSCLEIPQTLEKIVQSGFHEILEIMIPYFDFSTI